MNITPLKRNRPTESTNFVWISLIELDQRLPSVEPVHLYSLGSAIMFWIDNLTP